LQHVALLTTITGAFSFFQTEFDDDQGKNSRNAVKTTEGNCIPRN
jgi:hypothetical protein